MARRVAIRFATVVGVWLRGQAARALAAGRNNPGIASVVFAFALSRAMVIAVLILASAVVVPTPDPESGLYEPDIILHGPADALAHLQRVVDVGDASWYLVIATYGYEQAPFDATEQHSWAFFPLYPLLVHIATSISGELQVTAVVVSNLSFLLALLLLYRFARQRGFDACAANRATLYLAIYPSAYFFSLPTTESLFLLVTVAAFSAACEGRWWLAGASGALASATRGAGILVLLGLLIAALPVLRRNWRSTRLWPRIAGLLLVPLGMGAFMLLLAKDTGNPWAFRDVQAAWSRTTDLSLAIPALQASLSHPSEISRSWDFKLLNVAATGVALVATAVLAAWRQWDLAVYTLAGVLLPLSTGSFQAMSRYVMVLFPIFLVLGRFGRHRPVDGLIRVAFPVLLGLLTAGFAARFTTAMA